LLAVPAMWAGRDPAAVLGTSLEVLVSLLHLDLAYGQLGPLHDLRVAGRPELAVEARSVGDALRALVDSSVATVDNPVGSGQLRAVRGGIGMGVDGGSIVVASARSTFPDETERVLFRVACNQATIGLQHAALVRDRTERLATQTAEYLQLQALARASLAITSQRSLEEVLQSITDQARQVIGAHHAMTSLVMRDDWAQAITTVSESDESASRADRRHQPGGSEIYALVRGANGPVRMSQDELGQHSAQSRGSIGEGRPMRGWLAAPLVGGEQHGLGFIQLSDKIDGGDFDDRDEAMLVQLARVASVAIENVRLLAREQHARQEAERLNRLRDEFLATISHELRTPLNAILGWAKMLAASNIDDARVAKGLAVIDRNAQAQANIIEDILDVSRIITGKLKLNRHVVQVSAMIDNALDTLRPAAEAKRIALEVDMGADVDAIIGDEDRLRQVTWNLLSNAVKFTPPDGRVAVVVRRVESQVVIEVTDSGVGIEASFLPFVFDRFRQADGTSNRTFSGLGLGLAIVRHLVDLHGGTVRAESDGANRGSKFTVRLPLRPVLPEEATVTHASHRAPMQARSDAARRLQGLRILVVDDDDDARELLGIILEQNGARPVPAASVTEALALLETFHPDILVSDIGMPEEDGYALLAKVRGLGTTHPVSGVPAIALTAYARVDDRRRALAAGFQLHVPKPVNPAELVAAIDLLAR
jgi:signal transduction histidine kinase/ActR/RegA family two-component response regulator